jgi:broad specificity phosphatase PhoE
MLVAAPCLAQRAVVVVRHADKIDDSDDAALSSKGEDQAKRLRHVLKDAGISAVYVTQFRRTRQTVAPLTDALGIEPVTYEQTDVDGVVARIRRTHADGVVMVVGHRSTVPRVLEKLGCAERVALASDETDALFILTLAPGAPPRLLRLRY